jgi:lysophospholipase L1-like esterase
MVSRAQTAVRGLALGAIAVACAAGCSLMSPAAAPGGLQRQISQGAKADAAGRSQAAVAAKAASATAGTGATAAPATVGARSTAAAGTARRAGAKAGLAGRVAAQVPGKDITAIGDSVMLAGSLALQRAFPGIYVDAVISRFTSAGLSVLRQLAASGRLRQVVIVGLGTNGGVTTKQARQLMVIVGDNRKVVLVNTFVPLSYEHDTNNVLAATARTYPNAVLADWYQAARSHTSLLWPDGIHPQPSGATLYAAIIRAAVAQAVQPANGGRRLRGSA